MKEFIVKPDMGVLLNYFSAALPNFLRLPHSDLWQEMKGICRDGKATFETFYLFGAFDVLNLGISSSVKKIDEMQKIKSQTGISSVMDYFMHYGIVASLYPGPFAFKDTVKRNPLIGVITLKVRSIAWDSIYEKFRNISVLENKISELFKSAIEKTKKDCKNLNSQEYCALLLLSYDSEDAIVVLFTQSFQFIKQFTTNVRTLELSDFHHDLSSNNIKHIIASTHTILGMRLTIQKGYLAVPATTRFKNNIFDKLNWLTFFEVRPGHLQHAKNSINRIAKQKKLRFHVDPLVGRNDLIVRPKQTVEYGETVKYDDLNAFFTTHFELINGLSKNKSIESSETYISFPEMDKVESKKGPEKISSDAKDVTSALNNLIIKIEESPLSKLERESFIQIVRKLRYLLENRYLHDSFITLYPLVKRVIEEYFDPEVRESNAGTTLEIFTGFIELCYATRYQGSPPVGETAVYPTLGYYSLGQKVLTLLDYLGNWVLTNFAKKLSLKKFYPHYIATINMNCPAGTCIPIRGIGVSFIFLPPRPLFHPEILLVIFLHELGHVICKCFMAAEDIKCEIESLEENRGEVIGNLRDFEEIIAEFFSAKILAELDFKKYKDIMNLCLKSFGFKDTFKKHIAKMKGRHVSEAKKLVEIIKESNNHNLKVTLNRLAELSKVDNSVINKRILEILRFIANWRKDEVTNGIRRFLSSEEKQKEFWNLWILLNSLRGDCYFEF